MNNIINQAISKNLNHGNDPAARSSSGSRKVQNWFLDDEFSFTFLFLCYFISLRFAASKGPTTVSHPGWGLHWLDHTETSSPSRLPGVCSLIKKQNADPDSVRHQTDRVSSLVLLWICCCVWNYAAWDRILRSPQEFMFHQWLRSPDPCPPPPCWKLRCFRPNIVHSGLVCPEDIVTEALCLFRSSFTTLQAYWIRIRFILMFLLMAPKARTESWQWPLNPHTPAMTTLEVRKMQPKDTVLFCFKFYQDLFSKAILHLSTVFGAGVNSRIQTANLLFWTIDSTKHLLLPKPTKLQPQHLGRVYKFCP